MRRRESMLQQALSLTLLSQQLLELVSSFRWRHQLSEMHLRMCYLHQLGQLAARSLEDRDVRQWRTLTRCVDSFFDVGCEQMVPLPCFTRRNLQCNRVEGGVISGCVVTDHRRNVLAQASHDAFLPAVCAA